MPNQTQTQVKPQVISRGSPNRRGRNKTRPRKAVEDGIQAVRDGSTTGRNKPRANFEPTTARTGGRFGRNKAGRTTLDNPTKSEAPNLAPNQSGPSQSFQPGRPLFRPGVGSGIINGNPLNGYIDVMYHISMNAVSERAIKEIQPGLVNQGTSCGQYVDEMQAAVRKDGTVTLASTGEVYRNTFTEVTERKTQTIDATEAQRTKANAQIAALEAQFKDLKRQQAEVERLKPGTVTGTSPLIAQQWNVRRAIQAVKDGIRCPGMWKFFFPRTCDLWSGATTTSSPCRSRTS